MILVVLIACLGVAASSSAGAKASIAPCCSVCDACRENCDANNPTPQCFNSCRPVCIGCNPGC
jgi:hypothetical protein